MATELEFDMFSRQVLAVASALAVSMVVIAGDAPTLKDRQARVDKLFKSFEKVESFELFSLHPYRRDKSDKGFQGWLVLGKTKIDDAATRTKVIDALRKGIDENELNPKEHAAAGCFEPRHGIRLTRDTKTVDIVICFGCMHIHWHRDAGKEHTLTSRSPQPTFDKVLTDAGVKLAPKRGDK
jgi:hypothetical protein